MTGWIEVITTDGMKHSLNIEHIVSVSSDIWGDGSTISMSSRHAEENAGDPIQAINDRYRVDIPVCKVMNLIKDKK